MGGGLSDFFLLICLLWTRACKFSIRDLHLFLQEFIFACSLWCLSIALQLIWGCHPALYCSPWPLCQAHQCLHRGDRNQSVRQAPENPEHWAHAPIFSFPWGVSHWAVAASAVLHVFWSSNKLPCSLLFSVASRQLEYSWSRQHSKTGGTETVLTYSSEKLEHWTYAPTFAFPKEKLGVLDIFPKLLSYWLRIKTMVMKAF